VTISQFVQSLPKAEIHIHLEGAIQPETVLELARRHNKLDSLPVTSVEGLRRWFVFTDFPHFVKIYVTIQDLIRIPADFELLAYQCGADMAAQNVRYREITVTPYTHTHHQDKGLGIDDILAGLEAGRQRARAEFGVEMRWVFDIPRNLSFKNGNYNPFPGEKTLEFAVAGRDRGVVGFGLGGYEVGTPPEAYAHAFIEAKQDGLLSVPHAGETMGASSVWGAVNQLQADRIGHGVRAIEDPALLAVLHERQIPLEINPTSNICLGVYRRLAEHPFPHLDKMGLVVTVNSDDPPLFNTTLNREYQLLMDEYGYSKADVVRIARSAFEVCGAEAAVKTQLLSEFDEWVAANIQ
jgi:adenosine deaminase